MSKKWNQNLRAIAFIKYIMKINPKNLIFVPTLIVQLNFRFELCSLSDIIQVCRKKCGKTAKVFEK